MSFSSLERIIAICLLLCIVGTSIHAQDASIEQSRQFRGSADLREYLLDEEEDTSYDETAPTSPGDEDMGEQLLLREKKRYRYFTVYGNSSYYFTDNATLSRTNRDSDSFFVGTVGFNARYPLSELTTIRANVAQSFYRYNQATNLDFDSFDIYTGITKVFPDLANLIVSADYNYSRLTYPRDNPDGEAGTEFYVQHAFILSMLKTFPLSKAHYLFVGPSFQFSWANPDVSQRNEFSLQGGYHADITRAWFVDLNYRIAYFEFDGSVINRQDLNQSVVLTTGYEPVDWFNVSLTSIFGFNNSSNPALDFDYKNLGGSLNFQLEF
ncbi:MAG: hypothetical protein AAFY98_04465 [Verrucomicrobiota bacterium]